ncbi:hypothetical protein [Planosporangium mesophilum]|uniref:Uncharacterized protein n=1 Tax=Planosporangium mesophilum TaxID=689768 RepID=A0A8J3TFE0_9ACTN|nr:hypothetical protein [Planosporangium mesophilum]NJC85751.1 hypothetical protein [Planosporangium mesophilum]GII24782.1 hypothetical protein Pme01_43790 [Planosporangium mesophilum]
MNNQPPRHIDRRTAEQLLSGAPMGARHPHPPLAAVLTAAAVPGRPGELTSEDVSASAFRTAAMQPGGQPGRLSVIRSAVMRVLTVKVIAVAAATTTVGGVALAAGVGTLPNPLTPPAPASSAGFSAAHPAVTTRSPGKVDGSTGPRKSHGPDASKPPSPAVVGLCRAYLAGNNAKKREQMLANPAFSTLVTAAGAKDKVDGFCQALLAATPSASGSASPNTGPGAGKGDKKGSGNNEGSGNQTGNNTGSGNKLSANSTTQPATSSSP